MRPPRSASAWTMAVFGASALLFGILTLVAPDLVLAMLGFEVPVERASGDYTRTFLAASAVASLNMGVYYLVAVATDWRPFFLFTVPFRLLTCTVFLVLVLVGVAPGRFVGVAAWEGLGALATGLALAVERRPMRHPGAGPVGAADAVGVSDRDAVN
ncbi:MAG TPA: hypothetical protein VF174_16880 [Micromonosporaceae bacterium]